MDLHELEQVPQYSFEIVLYLENRDRYFTTSVPAVKLVIQNLIMFMKCLIFFQFIELSWEPPLSLKDIIDGCFITANNDYICFALKYHKGDIFIFWPSGMK